MGCQANNAPFSPIISHSWIEFRTHESKKGTRINAFPLPDFFLPVGLADLLRKRYETSHEPSTAKTRQSPAACNKKRPHHSAARPV
jgi:hypothetical protein